jgi:hypothetical protein
MKANMGQTRRRRWLLRLGVLAWAAVPGCCCLSERQHGCDDIPAGAIPVLTGTHTHDIFAKEAELAEAGDFFIYEAEWLYDPVTGCGSTKPGPYGAYHLGEIVKRLPDVPFPVLIQVNLDERLNETRRLEVVAFLKSHGIVDAEQRVIVGFVTTEGLFGDEAANIFRQGYMGHGMRPDLYGAGGSFGGNGAFGGASVVGGYGTLGGLGSSIGALGGLRRY